ncbi:MAG: nucleotidyl transferase AbiEii/AbiGii toxin family protein, partial [Candidatus Woesebacteria bacterium]|nr:nucleotidyl transferase AbiEii/AbiGii toxin family protein [Candidatus Woesebacteria bacterium]
KTYGLNKGMITAGNFRFLVNAYDLETMFANKIVAFLRRNFYKGKFQTIPFKGRDVYDLFWFLQLSAKSGYSLKPNQKRLVALTGSNADTLRQEVKDKIAKVKAVFVYEDVLPLVESDIFLRDFLKVFNTNIIKQIGMVM